MTMVLRELWEDGTTDLIDGLFWKFPGHDIPTYTVEDVLSYDPAPASAAIESAVNEYHKSKKASPRYPITNEGCK